jgi:hypothetical protein
MAQKISKKRLFLFSVIPLLFFLLIIEFGVRLFWEFEPNRYLCNHPVMGRIYCPGTAGFPIKNKHSPDEMRIYVEINSDGLLGKAYPVNRVPGKFRIALLGDSFAAAERVIPREKFTGVWERELSEKVTGTVEVINFAVGGTGTWQQLQMFHIKALKYKPDLTVLAFCWCNDIENNIDNFKGGAMNPLLDEYEVGSFKRLQVKRKNFNKWLWNNSALYQFTRTKTNLLEHYFKRMFLPDYMNKSYAADKKRLERAKLQKGLMFDPENKMWLKNSQTKKEKRFERKQDREVLMLHSKNMDEKKSKIPEYKVNTRSVYDDLFFFNSEGWELTRKLILKLKKEVKKNGSELALIHFGGAHQYRNFPTLPLKQFDTFLESNRIAHFNAFDQFIKIDDEFLPENFILNDGHFSETGHRHLAEFSTDFLLRLIQKTKL